MNLVTLTRAADAFIDAAFDPAEWPRVLQQMADAADATGMLLIPMDGRVAGLPFTHSIGDLVEFYFKHGWHLHDRRAQGVPQMMKTGIMADQDFISLETMNREPYYQEFMVPFGFQWFAGLGFRADHEIWCASFQRSPTQGPFLAEETRTLLQIGSRLTTSATLARRFGLSRMEGVASAFESLDVGVMLFDRAGRLVRANARAEQHIRDVLPVVGGNLVMRNATEQAAVRHHIATSVGNTPVTDPNHISPVIIHRPGRRPLVLRAVRLPRKLFNYFSPAAVVVLIVDPEDRQQTPAILLRDLFGLTKAEAALTQALGEGMSLEMWADENGYALSTARQLMKLTLAKTGTHRQAELVALIKSYRLALKSDNKN